MVLPSPRLDIYATSSGKAEEIVSALMAFQPTLPAGTNLVLDKTISSQYGRKTSGNGCATTPPAVNYTVQ